ncbi:DUF3943 domain-containing protein [Pontibacter cellulosilyticus]|uniref:DUF3943 domain-containing protein n=1 Tax=Pontibacter cellulosilyticus TaxID=1720253 RepID=A0A923N4F9_9BACT|nr:DUF3943 domain-containing protein [Pontibacter cellulosilyticus]MBC5991984.1 DUF3943 domain-containing protein [Pontibacter cellulosilyticus]
MKRIHTILFLLLATFVMAQEKAAPDTINPAKGNRELQLKLIKARKEKLFSDSLGLQNSTKQQLDSTRYNSYGDLLHDDPQYNPRQPLWKPAAQVLGVNALFMGYNRYIAKADYGYVSPSTWKTNLTTEPEWDTDGFRINFIGHPYQGTLYFNAARSQGYNYWQSLPFAVAGSLTWEYFGENTLPSYNDMVYTPLNGAALGEILYRVSSNILDDRTRGRERVMRELAAGLINPVRGLNRLLQGKTSQVTNAEVYEKDPMNVTLFAGVHRLNVDENDVFGAGSNNAMLNVQLDYGTAFEAHKPFDLFRLRTELSIGSADTVGGIINNITGYGFLFGKPSSIGKLQLLTGAFQYYDYWDTRNFVLGALGFGGGVFSQLPLSKEINLYTNAHLGVIPLAGNSTRSAPDSLGLRDYIYATGLQGKVESTLSLGKYASVAFVYYHFWLNTFKGLDGYNSIGIIRPRVTLRLFKNLSVGYEHFGYTTDRNLRDFADQYNVITDQKVFLQLFLENPQRRGRYN